MGDLKVQEPWALQEGTWQSQEKAGVHMFSTQEWISQRYTSLNQGRTRGPSPGAHRTEGLEAKPWNLAARTEADGGDAQSGLRWGQGGAISGRGNPGMGVQGKISEIWNLGQNTRGEGYGSIWAV